MKNAWEKWKKIAEKIGNFQANLIFSMLYFILITPIGLLSSLFTDFLAFNKRPQWHDIDDSVSTLEKMREQ